MSNNKKKFLKSLLTTASALAVFTGGIMEAGAGVVTTAGNVTFSANGNWGGGLAPADGDTVLIANANDTINANVANRVIDGIGFGVVPGDLTVTESFSVGSIMDTAGGNVLNVVFADTKTLTLTGTAGANGSGVNANDYTGLGKVDFATLASNLTINNAVGVTTLGKAFFTNADAATLNVNTNLIATNAANAGQTVLAIGNISVAGGKTLTMDPTGNNAVTVSSIVSLGDASTLILKSEHGLALVAYTLNLGTIKGAAANEGILTLDATTNALNILSNANETIGVSDTKRIDTLNIDGDAAVTIGGANGAATNVFAKNINFNGVGAVEFKNIVNGGAGSTMKFNAVKPVTFSDATSVENIDFNNKAATITLGAGSTLVVSDAIKGNAAPGGNTAGTIQFAGAATLTADVEKITQIKGHNVAVNMTINKGTNGNYVTSFLLDKVGSTFIFADGVNIDGNIDATVNGGNVTFQGTSNVTGKIGPSNALTLVTIAGNGTKTVTVSGVGADALKSADITFAADGRLSMNGANDTTITGNITAANANNGTILSNLTASKILTINGQVGNVGGNALKGLSIANGNTVILTNGRDSAIKTVDLAAASSIFKIETAGDYTLGVQGSGVLQVNGAVVLQAGSTVGVNGAPLALVTLTNAAAALTLPAGVSLYADKVNATTNGIGELILNPTGADIVVSGKIGEAGGALNKITVSNAGNIEFKGDIVLAGANNIITLDLNTNATFDGNVTATNLKNGTVIFKNNTAAIWTGKIGDGGAVTLIKLAGDADVTINGAINATAIEFAGAKKTLVTAGVSLGATNVVNDANLHNISVSIAQSITGDIGTKANRFGNLILNADVAANFASVGNGAYLGVVPVTPGKGTVNINAGHKGIFTNLGSADVAIGSVNINENTQIDFVNASDVVVNGKTVEFGTTVNIAKGLTLDGAGSTAKFADGVLLTGGINAKANGVGDVIFSGEAKIFGDLGVAGNALNSVTFAANDGEKELYLNDDIFSNVDFNHAAFYINKDLDVTGGKININNSLFDLQNSNLELRGNVVMKGDVSIASSYVGNSLGTLGISGTGAKLDASELKSILILVTSNSVIPDSKIVILDAPVPSTGFDFTTNVLVLDSNRFVSWDKQVVANPSGVQISAIQVAQSMDSIKDALKTVGITDVQTLDNLDKVLGAGSNTGLKSHDAWGGLDDPQVADAAARLLLPTTGAVVQEAELQSAQLDRNTSGNILGRMSSQVNPINIRATADSQGIAAGDQDRRFGAWFSPFFSNVHQSNRGVNSGYKSNGIGATIGADALVNDNLTFGVAATYFKSKIKHKAKKAGDRTTNANNVFSVYAQQQLVNDLFVQGLVSVGSGNVKNIEKRIMTSGNQLAGAKYDSLFYSATVLGGINYNLSDSILMTPQLGVRYTRFNGGSYKESGTTLQNLTINRRDTNKFEGILGARIAAVGELNGILITPELRASVDYDFRAQKQKIDARLDGATSALKQNAAKPNRTTGSFGGGITLSYGSMEFGAGYDVTLVKKYNAHQGSLKLRANF